MSGFLTDEQRAELVEDLKEADSIAKSAFGHISDRPRAIATGTTLVFEQIRRERRYRNESEFIGGNG